jgi:hypothetical protein
MLEMRSSFCVLRRDGNVGAIGKMKVRKGEGRVREYDLE